MKNVKNIITAFASVIFFSAVASAQSLNTDAMSVKYIGSEEGYLLFQVEVNTPANGFSLFKINDKTDGEIFSQSWKNTTKMQTFKIERKGDQELSFTLYAGKKTFTKSFSTSTSLIENTTVTETDLVKL
jgi:hypothetical protein